MTKAIEYRDKIHSNEQYYGSGHFGSEWEHDPYDDTTYFYGYVTTKQGIVGAHYFCPGVSLAIVLNGKLYCHRYERRMSLAGITTKARRFAKEVAMEGGE